MTVADSSVWIDYFNGVESIETDALDALLGEREILVGDLILLEVLQGFATEAAFRRARSLLGQFPQATMLTPELAVVAARNHRRLRRRGITVRKTIDIAIGTFCLRHHHDLLYTNRDFDPMVKHLGLRPTIAR
ncbi:MAG: PIN domain nuclease [Deltaproteobacteria bacterium]